MLRFVLIFLCLASLAHAESTCQGDVPCEIGQRSYHVLEPDDWDGQTALPVLFHFHGWQRQGDLIVNHQRIAGATRRRGVLLVAPNGANRTWNFWQADTPDVAFANAVLEDIARHYPIDPTRIYVSGYSYGGAMAWRFVCQSGNGIAALLSISGTIDQTTSCPQAPARVAHVHGLSDTVMDFPMGVGGDVTYPVNLWRRRFDCVAPQDDGDWQAVSFLTLHRTSWRDCAAGGPVTLDTHPGGHFIPHGWIARQLDDLLGLPHSYP